MYASNIAEESWLYVISWKSSPEVCKIGRTTNFAKRSSQFLTAHHEPLMVRCLCPELTMSEASLHERFNSQRITLEHFNYTEDLKAMVEILNLGSGFKPYTIERGSHETLVPPELNAIQGLKDTILVPPLKLSPMELKTAELAALGATVQESADALAISPSAVKSHRAGVTSKCFTSNLFGALTKLAYHQVMPIDKLL